MLHFPSANSAAHRPSRRDVSKLRELLDDDVFAFSNCRIDAPGKPVAEVDWFFYNVRQGTLMVSEWKGFPQRVVSATDTGTRWRLEGGLMVANPVEQVSRQLDAVRAVLRNSILPQHFPAFDPLQLRLMQSVYSPQVDEETAIERIRWGRVYGSLPDLAAVRSNSTNPAPLVLPYGGGRLGLAAALCALFRTSFPADVKAKLQGTVESGNLDVAQRISAIHRHIAALHEELADLVVANAATGGGDARQPNAPMAAPAQTTAPQAATAKASAPDRPAADECPSGQELSGRQRER